MDNIFHVGEAVQILPGAIYLNNDKAVPDSLINVKLFVRDVKADRCTIARAKTGAILGEVAIDSLKSVEGNVAMIETYVVQVPVSNLPVYHSANKNSGILKRLNRFSMVTIVDEKNGFGKIKIGSGWIELAKVIKLA